MSCKRLFSLFVLVFALSGVVNFAFAQEPVNNTPVQEQKKVFDATEVIFGHVADSHEWHLFSIPKEGVATPVALELHIPPVVTSVRFALLPEHINTDPDILLTIYGDSVVITLDAVPLHTLLVTDTV